MELAELLKASRTVQGISQSELAARSGTSQPTLSRYESGEAIPTLSTATRILAAAGQRLELQVSPLRYTADLRSQRLAKLRDNRRAIRAAVRRAHARNPAVFGSVARGTDRADSDIDILVDFDASAHGLFPLRQLEHTLSELLSENVSLSVRGLLSPRVAETALREALPL